MLAPFKTPKNTLQNRLKKPYTWTYEIYKELKFELIQLITISIKNKRFKQKFRQLNNRLKDVHLTEQMRKTSIIVGINQMNNSNIYI